MGPTGLVEGGLRLPAAALIRTVVFNKKAKGRVSNMSEKFTSLLAACAVTLAVFAAAAPATAKQGPITVTATRGRRSRPLCRPTAISTWSLPRTSSVLVRRVRYAAKDVCLESVQGDLSYRLWASMKCRSKRSGRAPRRRSSGPSPGRATSPPTGWSAIAPVAITINASVIASGRRPSPGPTPGGGSPRQPPLGR